MMLKVLRSVHVKQQLYASLVTSHPLPVYLSHSDITNRVVEAVVTVTEGVREHVRNPPHDLSPTASSSA